MEGDFTIGFALHDILIGESPDGSPIKSAVVEWNGSYAKPDKARNDKSVPRAQRLLMSVIREAIDEAGQDIAQSMTGQSSAPSALISSGTGSI